MTKDELLDLGFEELPHFTVMGNLIYDLGRRRELSIGCIGTPNEVAFISQRGEDVEIEDSVCVHNYDYDGYLTEAKIKNLISGIIGNEK